MKHSKNVQDILVQISSPNTKLGDLRSIAKDLKTDQQMALELWSSKQFLARLLAILIFDKKQLSEDLIDELILEISQHPDPEKLQLMDWLMANQLTKDKKSLALIESWENSPHPLKRRTFWYYQARLRWTGNKLSNSGDLLDKIENRIQQEEPEVQWAMNFLAGWVGVYEKAYRDRCISLGEKTGLFRDQEVSKGCTPDYLPEFIAIESQKRKL